MHEETRWPHETHPANTKPREFTLGNVDQHPSGRDLIVVGQGGPGSNPNTALSAVRLFNERGDILDTFFAYGPANSQGFVTVSTGEVDADRTDEIIVGTGVGGPGGGLVRAFDFLNPTQFVQFPAFGPGNSSGMIDVAGDKKSTRCDLTGRWTNNFGEVIRITQSGLLFHGHTEAGGDGTPTHEIEGYSDNRFAYLRVTRTLGTGFARPVSWGTISGDCDTIVTRWQNESTSGTATFARSDFERRPSLLALGPSPFQGRH